MLNDVKHLEVHDVTIIGAGPAGMAAALQLKRYDLDPLLLEAHQVGGLLLNANLVENYPGFPKGIPGPELVELFKAQLNASGVRVHFEEVYRLSFLDGFFLVETSKRTFLSRLAIVASGTKPIEEEICPSARPMVFYEVYPLLGTKGKKIVIVGAGDAAFDYALNLARANTVVILNRGRQIKALPVLQSRAQESPQITYCENTKLIEIIPSYEGLQLTCASGAERFTLPADYLLFAIGRRPALDFLAESLPVEELRDRGRLYFVGDVKNDLYRQTAIAVGDGVLAAMQAHQILKEGA